MRTAFCFELSQNYLCYWIDHRRERIPHRGFVVNSEGLRVKLGAGYLFFNAKNQQSKLYSPTDPICFRFFHMYNDIGGTFLMRFPPISTLTFQIALDIVAYVSKCKQICSVPYCRPRSHEVHFFGGKVY